MTSMYILFQTSSSCFCARSMFLTNFLFATMGLPILDGSRMDQQHISGGFSMDKEHFEFFKEPKEHFWVRGVLYRTLKTKERPQHSWNYDYR